MNEIMNESASKVAGLYKELTYGDQYGTSVVLVVILLVLLFLAFSYYKVNINIQPIKEDWNKYRCYPTVVPFAGMINKPEGQSTLEYTQQNFNYCLNEMLKPVSLQALSPLDYLMRGLTQIYTVVMNMIMYIRGMIDNIRTRLAIIIRDIYQRVLKILIPIQDMILRTKDILAKSVAIMKVALETAMGSYLMLKSTMGVMVSAGAWSLIIGAVVLVVLYGMFIAAIMFFPWTLWYVVGMIASFTAAYITVMVLVLVIMGFMRSTMEISPSLKVAPPPKKPKPKSSSCFDRATTIRLADGDGVKNICDVCLGDVLEDGGRVTATLKLSSAGEDMYVIDDVVVSGTHSIQLDGVWVRVCDHPDAVRVTSYTDPFLYCLNTTTKQIPVNNSLFIDWDEVDEATEKKLRAAVEDVAVFDDQSGWTEDAKAFVHRYFDDGFETHAVVELRDGGARRIGEVEIGDVLVGGSVVYGLVRIDKRGLRQHADLDAQSATSESLEKSGAGQLCHLLVRDQEFVVDGECVADYNHYIDSVN